MAGNDEASIRMTVDSSQAMSENQKYVRGATETFNELLRKSNELNLSGKQRNQYIEQEIALLKERNRLKTEVDINLARDYSKSSGEVTGRIRDIRTEAKKEDTALSEAAKKLKEVADKETDNLRKAEQFGNSVQRGFAGVFGANSGEGAIGGAASALLSPLGFMGIIAALAVGKTVKGAATLEPNMRDYAILTGQSMSETRDDVRMTGKMNLDKYGLTTSQYFTQYAQYERAAGGRVNENMLGIMAAQKATGVSSQQVAGLLGVERYGTGQVTPLISFFERYLKQTSQSIAILPEILQTFSVEAQTMIRSTGKVDSAAIAGAISAIGKGYGFQGEPLGTVTGALRQGLQQSSNPVIQSLQFRAMERAMPNASLWQMQMAMENPLTNPKYMTNFLDQLKTMTGGGEQYARAIFNSFGQYGITANIADKMAKGDLSPDAIQAEIDKAKTTKIGGFSGRAEGVTGELEKLTAGFQGGWEREGFVNIDSTLKELRNAMKDFSTFMSDVVKDVNNTNIEIVNTLEKDLKDAREVSNSWLEEIARSAAAVEKYQSRGGGGFVTTFQ